MAEIPFDTKENLQEFFEKAKKNYESVMKDKTDYSEVLYYLKFFSSQT